MRFRRKKPEPEGGVWKCVPCGFDCWCATTADLRTNVANHLQSPEHIERVKDD